MIGLRAKRVSRYSERRLHIMPSPDSVMDRMLEILSQLNPEYLTLALNFAVQEATRGIQDTVPASPSETGKESR